MDMLAADLKEKTKALLDETTFALSNPRNPPYSLFCAFTNMFSGINASLDITTGLFSAGYPGSFPVLWALNAE